jgi:hypothetical protein
MYCPPVEDRPPAGDQCYASTLAPSIGHLQLELHEALAAFRLAHADGVYSAARTTDPLLDLWNLASAIDRTAARPIEVVLRALVDRSVVTADELATCADEVEALLARL